MPAIEVHRIEAGIFAMTGIETDAEQPRSDGLQHGFEFVLELDESGRMRMHAHLETEFLAGEPGNRFDTLEKSCQLAAAQPMRLGAATGRWRALRRDGIDQHQAPGAVRGQRATGPQRGILHLRPGRGVVKGAEQYATDQRQIALGERRPQKRRILRHVAQRAELDARVARGLRLIEHTGPRWIARIVGEFNAPGAGRVTDRQLHGSLRC